MTTTTKTKCRNPECNRGAVQKGFCKPCIGSGKTRTIINKIIQKKYNDEKIGIKHLLRLRAAEDAEVIEAIKTRMDKTGISFNALVVLALAKYLKVPAPAMPKAGRKAVAEVEL